MSRKNAKRITRIAFRANKIAQLAVRSTKRIGDLVLESSARLSNSILESVLAGVRHVRKNGLIEDGIIIPHMNGFDEGYTVSIIPNHGPVMYKKCLCELYTATIVIRRWVNDKITRVKRMTIEFIETTISIPVPVHPLPIG